MYQAKVKVVDIKRGEFTLEDISDSDEIILERRVFLIDGQGNSNTYSFDISNKIHITGLNQDMVYSIDYEAIPDSATFGSTYILNSVFGVFSFSESLLLTLQEKIRCERKGICNDVEASKLIKLSSEVIYGIEAAKFHISKCRPKQAQDVLDYMYDYILQYDSKYKKVESNCGCGC